MFAVLLMLVVFGTHAETEQWQFRYGPRFWGATLAGRYMIEPPTLEDVETSITALLSGAYETTGYYRAADGSLFTVPAHGADSSLTAYDRLDLRWELGVQQGIAPRHDSSADLAVGFLLYRGQYDLPFRDDERLFFSSSHPERDGSLRGSVVGGLAYSRVQTDEITRVREGATAELALEWGPPFLHNQVVGIADYNRATLTARSYLPLYAVVPRDGRNLFSSYLAFMGVVDWATGPEIPLVIRATTGGRSVRSAPGGSVRGYASGRFDATVKAVGNFEVRANLPAIVLPQIVPGLLIYTDGGYFFDEQQTSPNERENSGILLSSGLGLFLDLFDAAQFVFYTNYLWTETSVTGDRWVPFSLGFGFHY